MVSLSRKNLFHDRVRLAATLSGIAFSVVLTAVQLGLFLGFRDATSNVIAHSGADFWIAEKGVRYIEAGRPFLERRRQQALAVPGVAEARCFIYRFDGWQRPDGAEENVSVAGFDAEGTMGRPWNMVAGSVEDLRQADAVVIDRLYARKLGISGLGQSAEINGRRARVVGLTDGIWTFTTAPVIFTRLANARLYTNIEDDRTLYLLVKAAPGQDLRALKRRLAEALPDLSVLTTREFASRTSDYWLFGTGAGFTVLIAAALGLIVGMVVVAQTLYSATVDHLREFGTLKAIGAGNGYVIRVILEQAGPSAAMGYAKGISLSLAVVRATRLVGTAIFLPGSLAAGLFLLTLATCAGASVLSIRKATSLDPAMVFK